MIKNWNKVYIIIEWNIDLISENKISISKKKKKSFVHTNYLNKNYFFKEIKEVVCDWKKHVSMSWYEVKFNPFTF
jgi:hypothetical protein